MGASNPGVATTDVACPRRDALLVLNQTKGRAAL